MLRGENTLAVDGGFCRLFIAPGTYDSGKGDAGGSSGHRAESVIEPDVMSDPAIERLINEYATAAASSGYKRSSRQARKAVAGFVKNSVITTDERILGVVCLGRSRWVLTTESLFDEREGKYGCVFDLFDCSIALDREVVSVVDGPDHRELRFSDGAEHVAPPATNQLASERARRFFDLVKRAQADFRRHESF